MKWPVKAIIVFLFVLYGAYLGVGKHDYALIFYLFGGFVTGWIVVGLLCVILWLARKFREKKPRIARLVGNVVCGLGSLIGIYLLGAAAYSAYEGAPTRFMGYVAGIGIAYLAAGWGIRHILKSN